MHTWVLGWLIIVAAEAGIANATQEPAEIWLKANTAYEQGNYQQAIELYQTLLTLGHDSGQVEYNLGNAYLRNGKLGLAIAGFLKAQREVPRDSDIKANLTYARKLTKDAITVDQTSAVVRALFFWHFLFSPKELLWLLVMVNAGLFFSLIWLALRRNLEGLRWVAMIFLIMELAIGGSIVKRTFFPTKVTVIQAHEANIHSSTTRDSVVRFQLHEGSEAKVMDMTEGWVRIVLPDGNQGWLEADQLEIVAL